MVKIKNEPTKNDQNPKTRMSYLRIVVVGIRFQTDRLAPSES